MPNLSVYILKCILFLAQGAQIIVFPEDAIHGFNFTRASIAGYLETVPDPQKVTWSPCADSLRFPDTEVQNSYLKPIFSTHLTRVPILETVHYQFVLLFLILSFKRFILYVFNHVKSYLI
uniref:CN hydrolase domain-containing protein n=1 Tax=Sinocyclocheilus grahami TaxID=75366 RepID=A0A672KC39_SINGR